MGPHLGSAAGTVVLRGCGRQHRGGHWGGPWVGSGSRLPECLHRETRKMVSNLVAGTRYVCEAEVEVVGRGTKVEGPDQRHEVGASAGTLPPIVDYGSIIAVEEKVLPPPVRAPGGTGNQDSVHVSPGDRMMAEAGRPGLAEPTAGPVAPITSVRGIHVELHIRGQGPVALEEKTRARP